MPMMSATSSLARSETKKNADVWLNWNRALPLGLGAVSLLILAVKFNPYYVPTRAEALVLEAVATVCLVTSQIMTSVISLTVWGLFGTRVTRL
jgi:hypothetical protein